MSKYVLYSPNVLPLKYDAFGKHKNVVLTNNVNAGVITCTFVCHYLYMLMQACVHDKWHKPLIVLREYKIISNMSLKISITSRSNIDGTK